MPGDARLIALEYQVVESKISYTFEVSWQERRVKRKYPFFESLKNKSIWTFELPSTLDALSEHEMGYRQEISMRPAKALSETSATT